MNKLSIIIPMLNEAETIENLLCFLISNASEENISEIIVVDGGSTDGSQIIVSKFKNITLIDSDKGRAKQMNCGANVSSGNILYFLHADSFPPKKFDQLILKAVNSGKLAGCFKMKFNSNHWWLKLAGWLTQFSWRASRGGDQSQFITKGLFKEIGGFDEQFVIYEDNDLINKLYDRQEFVVIQEWLTTSARRCNYNGIWKLQFHFWAIYVKKWLGATPNDLQNYYIKYIR